MTELRIGDDVFSTCTHRFKSLLDSYNLFPDLSREPEVAANGTYSVDDAFLGKKNAIDIGFYNAEEKNKKISYNDFEKRVTMNNVKY